MVLNCHHSKLASEFWIKQGVPYPLDTLPQGTLPYHFPRCPALWIPYPPLWIPHPLDTLPPGYPTPWISYYPGQ